MGGGPSEIAVANAPCSWGILEGFDCDQDRPRYSQVLDEMALAGYAGTELGDWGFMPADAQALSRALEQRNLALVGGFVPVVLSDASLHADGEAAAVRTAALLAECGSPSRGGGPFLVLADEGGPARMSVADRIGQEHGLSDEQWRVLARGAERIARAVRERTGLRTVFHPHCGTFVETPAEVERLLELTDADLIGLCFDTGHYTYGGSDALDGLRRFGDRVRHVHFKDCDGEILALARSNGWDYVEAVRRGVFCELGKGVVDFASILEELRRRDYDGWIVVENDVAPATGTPLEGARRDRAFLRRLGI